jgi:hypothetical protein
MISITTIINCKIIKFNQQLSNQNIIGYKLNSVAALSEQSATNQSIQQLRYLSQVSLHSNNAKHNQSISSCTTQLVSQIYSNIATSTKPVIHECTSLRSRQTTISFSVLIVSLMTSTTCQFNYDTVVLVPAQR